MQVQKAIITFRIDHCDPLGQGVDKSGEGVTFIAKTLPGETGRALICKSKKGVHFAKLIAVTTPSVQRRPAECPHFDDCPGCDYLHTDYKTELGFKTAALRKYFQKIPFDWDRLEVLGAPGRWGYRNRIQLHYRDGKIGLVDGLLDRIVEIPACKVIQAALRPSLEAFYADRRWAQERPGRGHCELYVREGKVGTTWNRPYAQGGFSQVNDEMNAVLRQAVTDCLKGAAPETILDLFSGDGNLSDQLVEDHAAMRVRVDAAPIMPHPDFIRLDLFKPLALKAFEKKVRQDRFDVLLLDPPRSGFSMLNDWVLRYRPKSLIYVSCHPGTLARDLAGLESSYALTRLMLIDLFPSTHHFEVLVFVRFRDRTSSSANTA